MIATTQVLLSKEAVLQTLTPYLGSMGKVDRERTQSLLRVMKPDGRIQLSDALHIVYPRLSNDDYDSALSAFRQFRLRLKTFLQNNAGIDLALKSDTQTRTKPHLRWCWFEGEDRCSIEVARFSANETEMVNRCHITRQAALALTLNETLTTHSPNISTYPLQDQDYPFSFQDDDQHDVMRLLDAWVNDKQQPYCTLLGEYGMGKTITCMRFTQLLLQKRKTDHSLPLPIYLDLRNFGNKIKGCEMMDLNTIIDSILCHSLYGNFAERSFQAKDIVRLVKEEGALIIFDGLDEVLVHLPGTEGQQFTRKLLGIIPRQKIGTQKIATGQVLLACRTHFFRTIHDQKTFLTDGGYGNISAEDFRVLTLQPLTNLQIYDYLKHTVPHIDTHVLVELIRSVHNLSELAERPYTLSLIPDLIPQIEHWEREEIPINSVTLYRHIVLSWLARDTGKHKLTIDHKQQLMEHFAAELWRSGKRLWNVADVENWFIQFLHARPAMAAHYVLGQDEDTLYLVLETMKEDLRTATFLVRIGDSDFCFAHTSLQEFFLATYLYRALTERRINDWHMPLVSQETLTFLGQLLTEEYSPEALDTLNAFREVYRPKISEMAFAYMILAHTKGYPSPPLTQIHLENACLETWNIAGKADAPLNLEGASFQNANLDNANLRHLNLRHTDFSNARLTNAEFLNSQAQSARFTGTLLEGAAFRDMELEHAYFDGAKLNRVHWIRCTLDHTHGLDLNYPGTLFSLCKPLDLFKDENLNPLDSLHGHSAMINDCVFSYDGCYLASSSWDKTVRIWDIATGTCLKVLSGHESWVNGSTFSPDGTQLVSVSTDKTLRVWDIASGECLKILTGHTESIRECAGSSAVWQVATASGDKTLRLWDIETGNCLHTLRGHSDWVRSCTFSNDGQLLASTSEDKSIRIWDAHTGECLHVLTGHKSWVRGCAFSPDHLQIITASGDKTLRLWDTVLGKCLHVFSGHESRVRDCAFSPCGKRIVSASYDQTLRVWDTATGTCLHILRGHQGKIKSCVFSPDGLQIASAADDQYLKLWDTDTGQCLLSFG